MNSFKNLMMDTVGSSITTTNLTNIVSNVNNVISVFLGLITAGVTILAILIAYKFFTADTEDKRKNAKAQLIYAIIGVVVCVALLILANQITGYIKSNVTSGGTNSMFNLVF